MVDIKKVVITPNDKWEAINLLIKKEQLLLEAINILESIIEFNDEDYRELHEKNIKAFLQQFK